MLPTRCPSCDRPVIRSPVGDLDAEVSMFGTWHQEGRPLTGAEHRETTRTRDWIGHHKHQCPPPPPLQLF